MKSKYLRIVLWVLAVLVMGATGFVAVRSVWWFDTGLLFFGKEKSSLIIRSYQGNFQVASNACGGNVRFLHFESPLKTDLSGTESSDPLNFFAFQGSSKYRWGQVFRVGYGWILLLEALIFGALLWKYRRRRERPEREADEAKEGCVGGQTAK
jgi:hypothetical protein